MRTISILLSVFSLYFSPAEAKLCRERKDCDSLTKNSTLPAKQLHPSSTSSCAVTYALDCGRFGDQLVNYIKALWVSYTYDIPLFYRPFSYSDQLKLSLAHPHLIEKLAECKRKQIFVRDNINDENYFFNPGRLSNPSNKELFNISFFCPQFNDWEDEGFRQCLKELICPIIPQEPMQLPKDVTTVAIHVRTGEGYDTKNDILGMTTKFPSFSFYIHGLKEIAAFYFGKPLFVFIFTDSPNQVQIRDRLIHELNLWDPENQITIECRMLENNYKSNVLEDFFGMMQFDCLIRPDSSFSRAASAVIAPLIEVTPPKWGECQKGTDGKILRDSKEMAIVDNLITIREAKGKAISFQYISPAAP